MFKVFSLFFVISIIFKNGETYRPILYANLTNYHIIPNNNVIEENQPRLIEWKKKIQQGPDGIQVYVFINKTGVYDELTDFCDEKFIIRVPNVLRQFLGIKSCPIEKGIGSFIITEYSEIADKVIKRCAPPIIANFEFKSKKDNKLIMTMDVTFKEIKLGCEIN